MENEIIRYAILKTENKKTNDELEELKEKIEEYMLLSDIRDVPVEGLGKLVLQQGKPKWKLPEVLVERENQLKKDIEVAKQLGTATVDYGKPFVQFYDGSEK